MTFIDWSDPEEMLGLLIEYVADERAETRHDRERTSFLSEVLAELTDLTDNARAMPPDEVIMRLRVLHGSQSIAFSADPVLAHVDHCIEELERIRNSSRH
ncbi:MAG TPA: hypothetical protein VFQ21_05995 [Gemmatimonadota bacterium]|nr:hypothetical protein [Gemmatimonadota bacterium]